MNGFGNIALGMLSEKERQRLQREKLQQTIIGAVIKQQMQPLDPSRILSELELMNVIKQMRGQGGLGQMPTGGLGQPQLGQMPMRQPQLPMGQMPITPQAQMPIQRQQPIMQPGLQAQRQPIAGFGQQLPMGDQPPSQFITIQDGVDKFGLPKYKSVKSPQYELWQKGQEIGVTAKGEVTKLSEKARANFGRSISLFSTMIAQAKGMQKEQREATEKMGIETTGLGLLPGMVGGFGVKTRRPWAARTAAFRGQMRETAIGLNSILTGQNRVIRSVVQMIQETLPDPLDPEPMMATKLAQSIMNAYRLVKAFEKAGLSPQRMQQMTNAQLNGIDARSLVALYTLTPTEQNEIERITDDVLATPAMPTRQFGLQRQMAPQPKLRQSQQLQQRQRAVNPQTGETLELINGRWQKVR